MYIQFPWRPLLRSGLAPLQAAYDGPIPPRDRLAALAGGVPRERRLEPRAALGQRRADVLFRLRLLRQARRQTVLTVEAEAGLLGDFRAAWTAYRQAIGLDRSLAGRAAD